MPHFFGFRKKIFSAGIVVIYAPACYNKDMKARKTAAAALAASLICGIAALGGAQLSAAADSAAGALTLSTENAALFLPQSYEQYLPLDSPCDVAINDEYIAIADGSTLYLYDRAERTYFAYENTSTSGLNTTISKIQFAETGDLYFSDASLKLYRFDPVTREQESTGANSSSFLIQGNVLYNAYTSGQTTLSRFTVTEDGLADDEKAIENPPEGTTTPVMAYREGELLCGVGVSAYGFNTTNWSRSNYTLASEGTVTGLSALCAFEGVLYYASADGIYRTDGKGNNELVLAGSGFKALTVYGEKIYCVQGSAVREISVEEGEFFYTDYEISAASSSRNRLSGAVDCVRAGNLLVTADAGNARVSVYNTAEETYSVVTCPNGDFSPAYVATDGETIAVSSEDKIYVFSYGDATTGEARLSVGGGVHIRGLACVYGEVYYVTDGNVHGRIGGEETASRGDLGTPVRLTCDIYGDLFVAYSGGAVYAYGEEAFTDLSARPVLLTGIEYPSSASALRSDFEGNLYYTDGDTLYQWDKDECETEAIATVRGGQFIYGTQDSEIPLAFALGFEDEAVYFCFGSYTVVSEEGALSVIPTLNEIATDGADEAAFLAHATDGLFVTVQGKSVGISTDLGLLKGSPSCFPYRGYFRTEEELDGVLLASTAEYSLVALYDGGTRTYSVSLFRIDSVTAKESGFTEEGSGTYYLSNAVSGYCAPALIGELALTKLSRGEAVSVLGYVEAEDCRYAAVADRSGAVAGYLPASYLTVIDLNGEIEDDYVLGVIKAGSEIDLGGGKTVVLEENTEAKLYRGEDGTYTAEFEVNGESYTASVTEEMLDRGETDTLRIALIVILTVLALLIVGMYLWMRPWKKEKIGS